jgi:hypothetical protein
VYQNVTTDKTRRKAMRQDRVNDCKALCEMFLKRASEWEKATKPETHHHWKTNEPYEFIPTAPRESAALKRTSMELTRALAVLRRRDHV